MSRKKPQMSLSDHIRLAVRLELARLAVMDGLCEILQHHVRKDSREYKKMYAIIRDLDLMKCWMDSIVCGDLPDGVGNACTQVYYNVEDALGGLHGELQNVFGNYAVRHAMNLLYDGNFRRMDADEIVLTKFDSHCSHLIDEERNSEMYLHIKAGTWYVYLGYDGNVNRRPPEDEINPNQTKYVLSPCQIRDFCEDAMKSGRFPTDHDIERVVGQYAVEHDEW